MRAPAWVRQRAEHGTPEQRAQWTALLQQQAVARLRRAPPPPAYWANDNGCGSDIEGQPTRERMFLCGTGFTPEISARFLVFYTNDDG